MCNLSFLGPISLDQERFPCFSVHRHEIRWCLTWKNSTFSNFDNCRLILSKIEEWACFLFSWGFLTYWMIMIESPYTTICGILFEIARCSNCQKANNSTWLLVAFLNPHTYCIGIVFFHQAQNDPSC